MLLISIVSPCMWDLFSLQKNSKGFEQYFTENGLQTPLKTKGTKAIAQQTPEKWSQAIAQATLRRAKSKVLAMAIAQAKPSWAKQSRVKSRQANPTQAEIVKMLSNNNCIAKTSYRQS